MYRENFTLPNNTAADELGEFLSQDAREEAEGLFQEAQALGEETQVNVTIGSKPRQSIATPFVLAFSSNLRLLADLGLSSSETRLLAYVIETMEFGNLLNFSQARAGKDLNYSKAHTSRLFASLKAKGALFVLDGHTYANPNLFLKGLPHRMKRDAAENLRHLSTAACKAAGNAYEPSIRQ